MDTTSIPKGLNMGMLYLKSHFSTAENKKIALSEYYKNRLLLCSFTEVFDSLFAINTYFYLQRNPDKLKQLSKLITLPCDLNQ
jgi:hypothetical protein